MYDPPSEAELKTTIAIKGALLGLSQLLANERPLKMMKDAFYFT